MKPGDLVRIHMAWSQYHGKFAVVIELGSFNVATVLVSGVEIRTFDCEVLYVVDETG